MTPFKEIFRKESLLYIGEKLEKAGAPGAIIAVKKAIPQLPSLELKQRSDLVTQILKEILPPNPIEAFKIIEQTIVKGENPKPLGNSAEDTFSLHPRGLNGFLLLPFGEYVAQVGQGHFEESMKMLKTITKQFSSEGPIRHFIVSQPEKTYAEILSWTNDPSEHVRRLCSEGTRPRLPWALRLQNAVKDPTPGIKILEKLKYDSSLYVRKSVANHLNDIAKDHSEMVTTILEKWIQQSPSSELSKIKWITQHALRTLIKKGYPLALNLIGIKQNDLIEISQLKLNPLKLKLGDTLSIQFQIENKDKKTHSVLIDIVTNLLKANGSYSEKVFKGLKTNLKPNEQRKCDLKLPLKKVTTREYYSGKQGISLIVNGNKTKALFFELKT
ncbi:MAG: hypothetical protein ACKVQC_06870 [Elusimicrobiota bacterium]